MVSAAEAQMAVVPCDWASAQRLPEQMNLARAFIEQAQDLPLVTFANSDRSSRQGPPEGYVFQTSAYRSKADGRTFVQPAFSEDFVSEHFGGRLPPPVGGNRPTLSFCGIASTRPSVVRRLKILLRSQELVGWGRGIRNPYIRAAAIRHFRDTDLVSTNFLLRDAFWGGAAVRDGDTNPTRREVRREFAENLASCDYALCVRGIGNFSYRLFEAMSAGRIPVIVDTDLRLPREDAVPWDTLAVWIPHDRLEEAGALLSDYHRLHADELGAIQQAVRDAWSKHLSPEGFFPYVHRCVLAAI